MGNGSCRTTRITSSTLVLIEGGSRPLRLLEARLRNLQGRYHVRLRRLRRCMRRVSILSFTSRRGHTSAASQLSPFSTQHNPAPQLPSPLPRGISCTTPPPCPVNLPVKR